MESFLVQILLRNLCRLIRLIVLEILIWIIRSSNDFSYIGLLRIQLLGKMNRFKSWSVSSYLNLPSLLIYSKLRGVLSILLRMVLSRVVLGILLGKLLLTLLVIILSLDLAIVLIPNYSIRYSGCLRFHLRNIIIYLLLGLIYKLSSSIRTLVSNS